MPRNPFLVVLKHPKCLTMIILSHKSQHRGCEILVVLRHTFDGEITKGTQPPMAEEQLCRMQSDKAGQSLQKAEQ